MKKFNVLFWDFNSDKLEPYDVLPYFREHCAKCDSYESLKEEVERKSRYNFWGRCEYEMICSGWPVQKNRYKLDIHEQIMMNIDNLVDILWKEQSEEQPKKRKKKS